MEEEESEGIIYLSSMPEGVVANILSLTTPSDACRSSAVSGTFHAAAQSDILWNNFLPIDWESLVSRRKTSDLKFDPISSSKKEIFFSLCDCPLLIDDGNKSFSLDKWSGKKCIMLGARDLKIIWTDTPDYWTWISHPESRFGEVAVLLQAWWVELRGKISCKMLSAATTYAAYFVFKMNERYYGFDIVPADAKVGIVGGDCCTISVGLDPYLDNSQRKRQRLVWMGSNAPGHRQRLRWMGSKTHTPGINMSRMALPKERHDGWFEIEMGEFHNNGGDDEVEMVLKEVNCNYSKCGLIVQGIEIRPKKSVLHR
ncbi:F-box protein PP2-B10-like [Cucurbita pepo subsp. pepo]|uniref:F-box protein PP2-B10-like n=1 Tax=Cucurbita pepo subsp. pepo TaxID=3664 RepID=UPI000C9D58BD|nr:F-box protein PP2-B10-like [Cucurbita pepo subsp. pepo]